MIGMNPCSLVFATEPELLVDLNGNGGIFSRRAEVATFKKRQLSRVLNSVPIGKLKVIVQWQCMNNGGQK